MAKVTLFNPDGTPRFTVTPFGPSYTDGVRVASGDVTGDGIADIAVGTEEGGPKVRVYRGGDFAKLAEFTAMPGGSFWGRIQIALADLNADGRADLAVSGLYASGVKVAAFSGASLAPTVARCACSTTSP